MLFGAAAANHVKKYAVVLCNYALRLNSNIIHSKKETDAGHGTRGRIDWIYITSLAEENVDITFESEIHSPVLEVCDASSLRYY